MNKDWRTRAIQFGFCFFLRDTQIVRQRTWRATGNGDCVCLCCHLVFRDRLRPGEVDGALCPLGGAGAEPSIHVVGYVIPNSADE